ncbi:glutathione transferase GST 23-like isoform X2 [Chenopodium quinoa]|uniref:glutathione transferase n=1 Tax=Chenopodium quinoa TaxID=63459 RepID=A0A803LAF8_CHEQI|nr:glutathione transferase GST 23-like isoform X2 [Chenopodium quinoa]
MKEVKLLGVWSSVYCHRVIWALKLKGVEYDYTEEDIANKSDELIRHNPVYQRIPVFIHNGKPIAESIIILEYIDEVWPQNPLLSADPYEKAIARFWAEFLEDKSPTFYSYFRAAGEAQEKLAKEAKELLHIIEDKGLGKKNFFGGNQIGYADICLGWIACWLELMQEAAGIKLLESDEFPKLLAWSKRFKQVPEINESLPDNDKMLTYFRGLRERFTAAPAP